MAEVKLPMTCGDVTLHALGKLDPSAPGSHDDDYVYPIGFRTSRKHASATNPGSKCLYHSEIVAGPNGKPQFKVTCQDMSEHPYEDSTPNGAWSLVFEAIASCTRRSSRGGGPQVSERKGWDLFGLNSEKIKKLLMDMEGVDKCTKLRYNKEKAAREAKERRKQEEEEEREEREREERERDKKRKEKAYKGKKKSGEYQQPPRLEALRPGEWRLMEEDLEVVPSGADDQVSAGDHLPEGEELQREQLHTIWQLAAVQQFLRSFRSALGVSPLTLEDFHTAFLECSSALKVIHLRLMMPAGERKRAPEMAEGDGWLDLLRDRLREQPQVFDEDTQQYQHLEPAWTKFLDADPMPDSIHQYFELSLRQRALILWWLCESLLEGEEDERLLNIGNIDWEASAESLRVDPNALDKDGNAYWYLEGSSGVLYKEGPAKGGRKAKQPRWEPISRGHEDLASVGSKLQQEGKKRKMPELQDFATWIVEQEAPKLLSKEQARERAKSKAALLEMLPRKRSSRVATKEERDREEEEKRQQREAELAARKAEEEKRRKERERQQQEKLKQAELAKLAKEEERQRQFKEAERERRLRKRRRLLAKQAQQAAAAQAAAEAGAVDDGDASEGDWWEIGNHVEVFSEDDWWQAVILKTRDGSVPGHNPGQPADIYVAYIGGTEDDNEWLPVMSVRVRPPTDSFWENDDGDGEDEDFVMPQANPLAAQSASSVERKARAGQCNGAAREQVAAKSPAGATSNNALSHAGATNSNHGTEGGVGMLLAAATQAQTDFKSAPVPMTRPVPAPSVALKHEPSLAPAAALQHEQVPQQPAHLPLPQQLPQINPPGAAMQMQPGMPSLPHLPFPSQQQMLPNMQMHYAPTSSQRSAYGGEMGVSSMMQGSMPGAGASMVQGGMHTMVQGGMHMSAGAATNGPVPLHHVPSSTRPAPGGLSDLLNSERSAAQPAGAQLPMLSTGGVPGASAKEEAAGHEVVAPGANPQPNGANGSVHAML